MLLYNQQAELQTSPHVAKNTYEKRPYKEVPVIAGASFILLIYPTVFR